MRIRSAFLASVAVLSGTFLAMLAVPMRAEAGPWDPPTDIRVTVLDAQGTVKVQWTDQSTNEEAFVVQVDFCDSDHCWFTNVASVRDHRTGQPQATGFTVSTQLGDGRLPEVATTFCFRVFVERSNGTGPLSAARCRFLHPGGEYVKVPHVLFEPASVAASRVRNAGLVPVFSGSGNWVNTQSPSTGTWVATGDRVSMHLAPGEIP